MEGLALFKGEQLLCGEIENTALLNSAADEPLGPMCCSALHEPLSQSKGGRRRTHVLANRLHGGPQAAC